MYIYIYIYIYIVKKGQRKKVINILTTTYVVMFCRDQYQTQTCFENALIVSASKHFCLHEYVLSIFIYLSSKMVNCLMELAIPNYLFKPCSRAL